MINTLRVHGFKQDVVLMNGARQTCQVKDSINLELHRRQSDGRVVACIASCETSWIFVLIRTSRSSLSRSCSHWLIWTQTWITWVCRWLIYSFGGTSTKVWITRVCRALITSLAWLCALVVSISMLHLFDVCNCWMAWLSALILVHVLHEVSLCIVQFSLFCLIPVSFEWRLKYYVISSLATLMF